MQSRRFVAVLFSLSVLATTGGCSELPSKHVYTEIEIDAPVGKVWSILADNQSYPDWNPYHLQVDGELRVGAKLDVIIHKPNGERVEIEPRVLRLEPLRELTWGGGIKGIFYGEHVFLLDAIGKGSTRMVQTEDFRGLAVPFAALESIEAGYRRMNQALKIRAEME